jgi:lactoylglutathione lyase
MLKKIDCVMIKVDDLEAAIDFYRDVFGLRTLWRDDEAVGLTFPDSNAEIVLHNMAGIPVRVDVNYAVADVVAAVRSLEAKGCRTLVAPFAIPIGKCAVIQDPFGTTLTLVDTTTGLREPNFVR